MSDALITGRLTDGERLWVWRKFRARLSQYEVMDFLEFGRDRVSKMENDLYPVSCRERGQTVSYKPPINPGLRDAELAALARRRSGRSLREVARRYGVSHMTLLKLEREGDQALLAWWASQKARK